MRRFWIRSRLPMVLFAMLAQMVLAQPGRAEEPKPLDRWDRFRGPDGSGVLKSTRVSLPWNESQVSRIDLPGVGNGSPSIVQDQVFLVAANPTDATRYVMGINLKEDSIAWQRTYESKPHAMHQFSSYASVTPCADGDQVYVAWAEPEHLSVIALTMDGQEVWSKDLGRYVSQHGFGTSPIVVDRKLILLNSQDAEELPPGVAPGGDTMLALDTRSGKTIWETPLPPTRVCYGVPRVRTVNGKSELLACTTALGIFALDLENGKKLWNYECFNQRVCSSALLIGNNTLIGTHGSGGGKDNRLVAYDIDRKKELFRIQRAAPYVPTPVADAGNLFLWSDNGIVTCVDAQTGTVRWSERVGGNYSGSPVIIGDKLINASHNGEVIFLAADTKYARLATIETKQTIRSTIAATNDYVLLRTDEQLWVIRPPE